MNDKVLVVQFDALLRKDTVERLREEFKRQIEEGVVIIPAYTRATVISKPDDVEILFSEPDIEPEFLSKSFNIPKEATNDQM